MFASLAREIQNYGNPIKPPCVLLCSGEATTKILDNSTITGHGGPGQELTLSYSISGKKAPGCVCLSIDSEGTDGTTVVAGGMTDSTSYDTACEKASTFLKICAATPALKRSTQWATRFSPATPAPTCATLI